MSGALPFPSMSDNRSFISDHARYNPGTSSYLYAHEYDDQRKAPLAKQQSPYRSLPPSGSRQQQSASPLTPLFPDPVRVPSGGSYGSPSDVNTPLSFSHDVQPSYRDHYSQMASSPYYSTTDSLHYAYPQSARLPGTPSVTSHSSSSHSPPAAPEQQLSPAQEKSSSAFPLSRPASKRREKPRIALAPDQPLTTQGKPRARVYVACIQCRSRKIRCDGAKPSCHNCSRRTTSGTETLQPCTYDPAPKRRGPDKHPGSRQRVSTQEITEGGRVRRRRRRDTAPADKAIPMIAQLSGGTSPTNAGTFSRPMVTPIRTANTLTSAVEAFARGAPEPSSHVLGKSELFHGAQQSGVTQTVVINPNASGQVPSMEGLSHPTNTLQRIVSVNEPQFPQVHTQFSPVQDYPHLVQEMPYVGYLPVTTSASCITEVTDFDEEIERKPVIAAEPSMQFARETWWDSLLGLYSTHKPQYTAGGVLTPGLRENVSQLITMDLKFLFRASNYWFAFINVPRFFTRLLDPNQRTRLQPSLILAALAVATFIRSSEVEDGAKGRAWALTLRDKAQSALDASLNSRWIDESLIQASWLIAFFEISAHPLHSSLRVRSALSVMDSLVRTLAISSLDRNDHRVSVFSARSVPTVISSSPCSSPINPWQGHQPMPSAHPGASPHECACSAYTLGNNWAQAQEYTPLWLMTPAWNKDISDAEMRKEETRRLVWSCVTLIAGYTSYTSASNPLPTMDLFLMEPANYALLFPGESLAPLSPKPASKDTVWALYMRTMLLWHSCVRMRSNTSLSDAEKAQFAVQAWLEVDKIEEALNSHTCGIERAFLFQGREYLFNSRMCISYEFQRFIPQATANANLLFHRKKAEEWLIHQARVAERTSKFGLQTVTMQPNVGIHRRPFFIFWFMSQVSRALMLWSCDNTLTIALDVSKALLGPIEKMMAMWPCPEQRKRYNDLRDSLAHACYTAGISPPPAMDLSPPTA